MVSFLRLGVVGAGDVAQRDYLPELPRLDGRAQVTWICSRGSERARRVAERFGIPRWTTDYGELVSAADVDAVLNLTPFAAHAEVTLAALRAGKHVYSEKPLALSDRQAREIAEESERRGLVVVPAPSIMLFPQLRRARALVEAGVLGPIFTARAHAFGGVPPWAGYRSDPTPYFAADGGPLVDMGVYALHGVTGLLGPARRVSAVSSRTRDSFALSEGPSAGARIPVDVDDNWHLILELENGCLASVQTNNCASSALAPELELQGERGSLGVSLLDVSAPLQLLVDGEATSEVLPHERAAGPDHLLGVEHLVDCVELGRPSTLRLHDALHVIAIVEAAAQAARERKAIDVSTSFADPPSE